MPGAVGVAVVASVYLSAHLVDVVARVGGFGRPAILVAAVLIAVRHRRPSRGSVIPGWPRSAVPHWPAIRATLLRADAAGLARRRGVRRWSSRSSSSRNGWRETPDGWVSGGWNWSDLLVHVAIGSSIVHGNFPPEVPYFAGSPLTYHWFADFHGAITSSVGGRRPIIPVYFATSALFAGGHGARSSGRWRSRLTGDRRVAAIATILVCLGGGMGWLRLVGDLLAGDPDVARPRDPEPVRQQLGGRLAVLPDRLGPRDRVPARTGRRRSACPGLVAVVLLVVDVPRPAAGRRAAGGRPGRAPRAVPVLRVPGDLPHRRPVRR